MRRCQPSKILQAQVPANVSYTGLMHSETPLGTCSKSEMLDRRVRVFVSVSTRGDDWVVYVFRKRTCRWFPCVQAICSHGVFTPTMDVWLSASLSTEKAEVRPFAAT